jgi:hypothetical protein
MKMMLGLCCCATACGLFAVTAASATNEASNMLLLMLMVRSLECRKAKIVCIQHATRATTPCGCDSFVNWYGDACTLRQMPTAADVKAARSGAAVVPNLLPWNDSFGSDSALPRRP